MITERKTSEMDNEKTPGWFVVVICLIVGIIAWSNLHFGQVDAEVEKQWVEVEGEIVDYRYSKGTSKDGLHHWYPIARYRSASGEEFTVEAYWAIQQEAKPETGRRLSVYHHPENEANARRPASKGSRWSGALVAGVVVAVMLYVIFKWWTGRGRA